MEADEKYVRKDVFDETIRRMETLMDKHIANHERIAERLERKIDVMNTRLEGKIDAVNARFDALQGRFAWNLARVAIVISVLLTVVQRIWK